MDEILNKLLASELLSEEVKAEISTKWTESVAAYKAVVKEEVTAEVRAELHEEIKSEWKKELAAIVESVDAFIADQTTKEVSELKGDIETFRDLEAEYASKIVEEKNSLSAKFDEEINSLVGKLDKFIDARVAEEIVELKSDLELVKQNDFGRRIYEAFAAEFDVAHVDGDSIQASLVAANGKIADAEKTITELNASMSKMVRESKLDKLLSNLSGDSREKMAFILQNVETVRLEEAYKTFVGRVLKDPSPEAAPQQQQVVTESVVVTGEESVETPPASKSVVEETQRFAHLKRLAGIAK